MHPAAAAHGAGCTQAVLRLLQAARVPVGIITNGHAEVQRAKLARIAAASLFPTILVGHEEIAAGRAEKPDRGIFLAACRAAKCTPHRVRLHRCCCCWRCSWPKLTAACTCHVLVSQGRQSAGPSATLAVRAAPHLRPSQILAAHARS